MPAPRERLIQDMNWREIDRMVGWAKFQESKRLAFAVKRKAEVPVDEGGLCPVDRSPNRTGNRTDPPQSHMYEEHYVRYLGTGTLAHAVEVDKDYSVFVYDGAQGRRPRPWIAWAVDAVRAEEFGAS